MIYTESSFYYGFKVNAQPYNGYLNIDEGAGEIAVAIPVGSYTLNTLTDAIRNALLSQATLDYTVTVDRSTRSITISATSNFDLLVNTGSNAGTGIWQLIGFNIGSDKTGANTYSSDYEAGSVYKPQFRLQSYVPPEIFQGRNQASKNVASNGTTVEVVNFGIARFIEFDIKYITSNNDLADFFVVRKNARGLEDAIEFLQYVTELNEFEFIPDRSNPGDFYRVIVESMPNYPDGTGYKLKELFNDNVPDIYETGIMKLRVIS